MPSSLYQRLSRGLRHALALGAVGLVATGCVDELVVGLRQPLQELDGGTASEQDADLWPDAQPREDARAEADARAPADASAPPADADPPDAGCGSLRCGPSTRGPCSSCDVVTFTGLSTCDSGVPETCWDDGSGTCALSCPSVATCSTNSDCTADEYCFYPKHDCGAGSRGLCAPRPLDCPDTVNTACGCDGSPYTNLCLARLAGHDFYKDELATCK